MQSESEFTEYWIGFQRVYLLNTLGAGPKPVCHTFTGANFTWNS